jgi:adenylate cyclase
MFTDIVGYSTLTHSNENLSLELLQEHRAIVRPLIEKFSGHVIDTAGDGFAVDFSSTLSAVQCAIEIQSAFAARNSAVPLERKIKLRIGVHTSDVLEDADKSEDNSKRGIFGDGVNIAARLQPRAPSGGICISGAVFEQIQGKLNCAVHSMGSPQLKGIKTPIRLYSVEVQAPSLFRRARRKMAGILVSRRKKTFVILFFLALLLTGALVRNFRPAKFERAIVTNEYIRVAVLPFDAVDLSPEENYLPDALAGALIGTLSQKGFHVLAQDSVFELKKSHKSPEEIGRELHIGKIVTGRLAQSAGSIKASVSIIDTGSQEVLWTQDFVRGSKEMFDLQKDIVGAMTNYLGKIPATGTEPAVNSLVQTSPAAPEKEAYLAYLKGQFFLARRTQEDLSKATVEFEKSAALDPNFAPAYAALSKCTDLKIFYGITAPADGALKMLRFASEALRLDPNSIEALLSMAEERAYFEYDSSKAEGLFDHALALNPRNATAHQWYAEFLAYQGRFKDSFEQVDHALNIDPLSLVTNVAKGYIYYLGGENDKAISILTGVRDMDENFMLTHYWLGRAYLEKKNFVSAISSLKKSVELSKDEPMMTAALATAYAASGDRKKATTLLNSLKSKTKNRYISPYYLAAIEVALGQPDEAIEHLRQTVKAHTSQAVLISVDPELRSLRTLPAFKILLTEIKPSAF